MKLLLFLSLATSLYGQRSLLLSYGTAGSPAPPSDDTSTNTQMILSYTAPDSDPCTLKVSESASLTPLVHDVDTAIFSGSNADDRTGNYSSGTTRIFVVGKRSAEQGTDGHWYSRALQVNTMHYYERTCGAQITTGTFTTANILLGNTYSDPFPGDIAAKGYYTNSGFYKWPEFTRWDKAGDPTAQGESIIDPQSGMLTKRIRMPNDEPITYAPQAGAHAFSNAVGSGWTNASNVIADDSSSATFSGAGKDWIFIGDGTFNYGSEAMTLNLKAWCSVGTCTGENNKIEACLSINGGSTCWPTDGTAKIQEVSLGTTANPSTYVTLGTAVPVLDSWTPAGYQPIGSRDLIYSLGFVDVDGSGVVTWTSSSYMNQTYFNPNWTAGSSKIVIGASTCTITTITNAKTLSVTPGSCTPALTVPVSGASYTGGSFGFRVRKKNTNTDQINIQYAIYGTATSLSPEWPASGSAQLCSYYLTRNSVTGEDGYHCVLPSSGIAMLYWISRDSGTVNYLGFFQITDPGGADGYGGSCFNGHRTFIGTTPTADEHFYCVLSDTSVPSKQVVTDCTLTSTNQSGSLSYSCTNLTKASTGKNLSALLVAFTASDTVHFDPNLFGCSLNGRQGTKIVGTCFRSNQDTLAWTFVFDPNLVSSAAGCVGGVLRGCIVAAMPSWAYAPVRWCVNHTPFIAGDSDLVWTAGKYFANFGNLGDGPYTSTITSGSLASATGAIAPGVGLCPAGTLRCDTVVVDGEPCDATPASGEAAASPCAKNASWVGLQSAIVGDMFIIDNEWIRLAAKSGTSWTFQRGFGHRGASTHAGAELSAYCSAYDFDPSEYTNWSWTWDTVTDPHGTNTSGTTVKIAYDYSHVNPDPLYTIGGNPYWDTVGCPTGACYGIRTTGSMGDAPDIRVSESPKFAGVGGPTAFVERAQDHPSWLQKSASSAEKLWFLDARPYAPQEDISDEATLVSGQLYKLVSTTSDGDNLTLIGGSLATLGAVNRKKVATIAYCGTQPLVDISNATTATHQIGTTSSDNGKYCVARKAGECRTTSTIGDIYVNCANQFQQYVAKYTCSTQDQNLFNDICITNIDGYLTSVTQMGFGAGTDTTGLYGRALTKAFSRYKLINPTTWMAQALPDASWIMMLSGYGVTLGKLPPYPTPDAVVRTTFVSVPITVPTVADTHNAIIQFGYAENGAVGSYFCTSRQEKCMVAASTVQAIPFSFPSEGTAGVETGLTGLACASGCTIALPGISQRVMYYQIKYRDAANATVATDPVRIINIP